MKHSAAGGPWPAPAAEFPGRFGWRLVSETIYAEPPWQSVGLVPEFPGCNPAIAETGILWDVLEIHAAAARPGAYYVLNCGCGYPPDSGLEAPVFVSHPDEDTIIWEIDCKACAPALIPVFSGNSGSVRRVFARQDYEAEVEAMLRAIRTAGSPGVPVEELEPDVDGMAFERAMALEAPAPRRPVLPPGTALEFGFFGSSLFALDGKPDPNWPVHMFPRQAVYAAFQNWLRFVRRGFTLKFAFDDNGEVPDLAAFTSEAVCNDFFLLRESERTACNRAGAELVSLLRQAFEENRTASGVVVTCRACDCLSVLA